ncbi:MAG: 23S rRNA (guanosine(2251)-2'-O)-methyltransferase RlmB [Bacteroidales bacterium]|nr:23S rRNA (guanosine(2251)-2'-O)-methyltransferase RlmB [Bacteroidales bacterium]MBR1799845.1 23S rRNA (guanosine(2251)-2'-O)-methyltransferase RlmB [Bacteroidales bacterium]
MENSNSKPQIVYGLRPVMEALEAGKRIDKVMLQAGLSGELVAQLRNCLQRASIPIQYVPAEKLDRLIRGNHQGVVATMATVTYRNFIDLIPSLEEQGEVPFVVMLDHITDVRNIGAIARTAECAGVHAIVVPAHGSAQLNQDAIKTSSGALLRLPVCREDNLKTTINVAKQYGMQVVAASEKAAMNYRQVDFGKPTLLIMGNEEHGISNDLLKMSDIRAKLPIMGEVQSLNVSVAAGVFMYEALSQRNE